jgi:hypothetical protein
MNDTSVYFKGAIGFGDNFYQRPIIRYFAKRYKEIYMMTTCPDIYWDIENVHFVDPRPALKLRTHNKYLVGLPAGFFSQRPEGLEGIPWRYRPLRNGSISRCEFLRQSAGMEKWDFDFSFFMRLSWIEAAQAVIDGLDLFGKKLCLIKPPTIRKEWFSPGRNPKIEYIQMLIDKYADEYFYLGFADLQEGNEWLDGELYGVDATYYHGELSLTTLFALIKLSDMIITPPTWPMLAGIAERVRCFTVFGGVAPPKILTDDRLMNCSSFAYVAPEPFCACWNDRHECRKDIPEMIIFDRFDKLRRSTIEEA